MDSIDFLFAIVLVVVFIRLADVNKSLKNKITFLEDEFFLLKDVVAKLYEKKSSVPEKEGAEPFDEEEIEDVVEESSATHDDIPVEADGDFSEPPPVPEEELFEPAYASETVEYKTEEKPETKDRIETATSESELGKRWRGFIENVDWELFAGTRLFAWLGALALFVGAVFFVKLSIEKNWIPPGFRLAVGAVLGISLILFSARFKKKNFTIMRHTLTAAGIGTLYTVAFTATLYYNYLPKSAGFLLLSLISITAFVLAVYYNGISISVLGAIGAYATPLMVSTGEGSLLSLFIYLAVVNTGLFKVSEKLKSQVLLLTGNVGTIITLGLAVFDSFWRTDGYTIAGIWTANLLLFTFFMWNQKEDPEKQKVLLWNGIVLYVSPIVLSLFLIIDKPGWHPLLLTTVSITGAMALASVNRGWLTKVIPYSVLTFIPSVLWVLTRFNADGFSVSFVLILFYGMAGCLGPVFLVQQHGKTNTLIRWFKIFPVAISGLCLAGLYQNPSCSFLFWPMMLGLQIIGIGISILFRALIQVVLLIIIFVAGGLVWMNHIPSDVIGFGFFAFILAAGGVITGLMIFLAGKLPHLLKTLKLDTDSKSLPGVYEKWLTAAPAAGVFVLIGAAFFVKHPHFPHPGMVTLACFLGLSLFFSKRIAFEPPGVIALLSAVAAQAVWVLNPANELSVIFSAVVWSSILFLSAVISPFVFFKDLGRWKRLWNSWALFEVLQSLFVFYTVKQYWLSPLANWVPLLMVFVKLPVVTVLLKRLEGTTDRNSILAFHGGALLFYVSTLPVLLLSQGWIGLALVFEATALLWLNRRIEHPGLRKTAFIMAPAGLVWLLVSLPGLKSINSIAVFNPAVFAVAAAGVALGFAVKFSGFPERKLIKIDLPNYFLWLATGTGFYLLNLIIADVFALPGTKFRLLPGRDFMQSASYALVWTGFGAVVWRMIKFPLKVRAAGFLILSAGACWLIGLPVFLPEAVAAMNPFFNNALYVYLLLAMVLFYSFHKEPWEDFDARMKNILLAFFLIAAFMMVKIEKSTIFQTGYNFTLFFGHTPSKAIASASGAFIYGVVMLIWPKRLDMPFRIAGLVLVFTGIVKALIFPFRFKTDFGLMTPLLNSSSLMYVLILSVLIFFIARNWKQPWPVPKFLPRPFFAVAFAVTAFLIMNIEIAGCLGLSGQGFSLSAQGNWAKLFGYSIGWLVFSIGLLAAGIKFSEAMSRRAAILLLAITAGKVFIIDLASLDQLFRVGSFVGLAFVLIFVSYLYQKFLSDDNNEQDGNDEKTV